MNMKLFYKYLIASFALNSGMVTAYTIARWLGGVGVESALAVFLIVGCAVFAYRETVKAVPGAVASHV